LIEDSGSGSPPGKYSSENPGPTIMSVEFGNVEGSPR
jgi:hypothetical protein